MWSVHHQHWCNWKVVSIGPQWSLACMISRWFVCILVCEKSCLKTFFIIHPIWYFPNSYNTSEDHGALSTMTIPRLFPGGWFSMSEEVSGICMFRKHLRWSLSLDKFVKHHFYDIYANSGVYTVGYWCLGLAFESLINRQLERIICISREAAGCEDDERMDTSVCRRYLNSMPLNVLICKMRTIILYTLWNVCINEFIYKE